METHTPLIADDIVIFTDIHAIQPRYSQHRIHHFLLNSFPFFTLGQFTTRLDFLDIFTDQLKIII